MDTQIHFYNKTFYKTSTIQSTLLGEIKKSSEKSYTENKTTLVIMYKLSLRTSRLIGYTSGLYVHVSLEKRWTL